MLIDITPLQRTRRTRHEGGFSVLESLISILIFSMGILAVVGLQAAAIKAVSDSQYRLEASFLANRIVTDMWSDIGNVPTYQYPGGGAARLTQWVDDVKDTLPGASGNAPTIGIAGNAADGYRVTVNIFWKLPGNAPRHSFTSIAYINAN